MQETTANLIIGCIVAYKGRYVLMRTKWLYKLIAFFCIICAWNFFLVGCQSKLPSNSVATSMYEDNTQINGHNTSPVLADGESGTVSAEFKTLLDEYSENYPHDVIIDYIFFDFNQDEKEDVLFTYYTTEDAIAINCCKIALFLNEKGCFSFATGDEHTQNLINTLKLQEDKTISVDAYHSDEGKIYTHVFSFSFDTGVHVTVEAVKEK